MTGDKIVTVHSPCPLDFNHCRGERCRYWKGYCAFFEALGIAHVERRTDVTKG
jgi:hypothetical protein